MTKFEKAKKEFPMEANFDPITQNTVDDLVFAVEGELELLKDNEGHYRDMDGRTKNGIKTRLNNFIEKFGE